MHFKSSHFTALIFKLASQHFKRRVIKCEICLNFLIKLFILYNEKLCETVTAALFILTWVLRIKVAAGTNKFSNFYFFTHWLLILIGWERNSNLWIFSGGFLSRGYYHWQHTLTQAYLCYSIISRPWYSCRLNHKQTVVCQLVANLFVKKN